ncbi:MAG: restriction endonuclease subunit S [Saprospiraceae bacterium]|nr:restriction endonuclease subunit S [Saprospiraceae bacterium]
MSFMTGSSGQSELDKVVLMNLKTKMPTDRTTQQKIASVLSTLDSKIELNNRINAELEAMAKTLYDYWFVQFDFPDENGKPYKSNGGKMVWNEALKPLH